MIASVLAVPGAENPASCNRQSWDEDNFLHAGVSYRRCVDGDYDHPGAELCEQFFAPSPH